MFKKLKYLYSKIILFLQIPSIRDSNIDKNARIGAKSNVIRLNIEKYSYVGNNCSITDVDIGKYCSIASYCSIGGGDHPIDWVSTSPIFYENKSNILNKLSNKKYYNRKVKIGNDVWIGEKCFIKSGINIGNGVIIGAHSVVTKDVPDYAIVVGSPAQIIKYRFDSKIINELLKIKWWDLNDFELDFYRNVFNDPKKFIEKYNGNIKSKGEI